jgi:DNA-binding transcriptional ArsR family regulator
VIVVELDAATMGRVRLAPSPMAENVSLLHLAASGRRDLRRGDPGSSARWALRHPDVSLVTELLPSAKRGYMPDLLTPKPPAHGDVVTGQLEAVARTTTETAREQLALRFGRSALPGRIRATLEAGTLGRRVANGLFLFWRATLADRWPTLRRSLESDMARRTRDLGRFGVAGMIGSLHPDVHLTGSELRVHLPPYEERHRFEDAELVLSPRLFGWSAVSPQLCRSEDAVLRYPCADDAGTRTGRAAPLATLLGPTRSGLLADLTLPTSTTDLAARHHLAPATASYHLGVLHDCGLVDRCRDGRRVLYSRSTRADLLWPLP